MLPSSLNLLVEMAAQLAWPITQALCHSLWIGVLAASCLWLIERIARRTSGETAEAGARPELPARHRFLLSLATLTLVATSLPLSFSLVFDRDAFDEVVAASRRAGDVVLLPSPDFLAARPIAQLLDDARRPAYSAVGGLAEANTGTSNTDVWNDSTMQYLRMQTRRIAPAIAAFYSVGVLAMVLRLAIGICGGRRLAQSGQRLTESALMASLHDQAARLGVTLETIVATCERVAVPVVVGVFRPVILLPASLLSGLAPEDVETILAHELAHLRRRDHLTILVQRGLEAVVFYHPVAWWLGRRIDALREDACDDLVIDSGIDRLDYATTLLRVAELRTQAVHKRQLLSQLAVDGGHPSKLRRRIERIVASTPDPGIRVRQSRSGLALLTGCVALTLAFLVQIPAQSQIASPPEATNSEETAGDRATDSTATRPESPTADKPTTSDEPDPIRKKLDLRTDFTAHEMPLLEVLDFVERKSGVPVTISLGECMLRGVNGQSPVSLAVKDATFAEILSQAMQALNLTFEITSDGIRIPSKTPAFEFRIVPELPTSNARVRLPEDWKENSYRDGTGGEANVGQDPGFAWFPVQPLKDDPIRVPAMESRGNRQIALLSDDAQCIVTPDGRWHVQDVRLEHDPSGQKRLAMTIDEVGGARIRKLTQAAMNQKIAMLVHGVVIMAPTVQSEIGEKLAISGTFSDEQWQLIEQSVKQAMLPASDEFTFDCDVRDERTGKPVHNATVRWIVRKSSFDQQEHPLFDQTFTSDDRGQFTVIMPRDAYEFAKRTTVYEVSHPSYLGRRNVGAPLRLPDAPGGGFDLRHLKLTPGVEVTGRFFQPDGTPAANLKIMLSENRNGPGSGYPGDVISHTDENGRFRVVTSPGWPKRLHWLPDAFVTDSIAVRKKIEDGRPVRFIDTTPLQVQTIRLKYGPRISGVVLDVDENPLAEVTLHAVTGTRVPIRSAVTGLDGHFSFPPLPPAKEYRVTVEGSQLTRPFRAMTVKLPVNSSPQPLTVRQVPSRPLTIVATNEDGLPATGKRFTASVPPYSSTTSEPDARRPGTYHVWIPDNVTRCQLTTAFTWGTIASWHLAEGGPSVNGNRVSLDTLEEQSGPLFVRFRQPSHIRVAVKARTQPVPLSDARVSVTYNRPDKESRLRLVGTSLQVRTRQDEAIHYIDGVAPGEDVVIAVDIKGTPQQRRTIRLAAGETRYLTIDIPTADDSLGTTGRPAALGAERGATGLSALTVK